MSFIRNLRVLNTNLSDFYVKKFINFCCCCVYIYYAHVDIYLFLYKILFLVNTVRMSYNVLLST